jgi:hypothetical protein
MSRAQQAAAQPLRNPRYHHPVVRPMVCLAMACAVALLLSACDGCQQHARGVGMCGKCTRSTECARSLRCVAGVCETAPPSCHVQIGL